MVNTLTHLLALIKGRCTMPNNRCCGCCNLIEEEIKRENERMSNPRRSYNEIH